MCSRAALPRVLSVYIISVGVVGNVDRIFMKEMLGGVRCGMAPFASGIAAACADARTRVLLVLLAFYLYLGSF